MNERNTCTFCSAKITEEDHFCSNCGGDLGDFDPELILNDLIVQQSIVAEKVAQKELSLLLKLPGAIALIIGFISFFYFSWATWILHHDNITLFIFFGITIIGIILSVIAIWFKDTTGMWAIALNMLSGFTQSIRVILTIFLWFLLNDFFVNH